LVRPDHTAAEHDFPASCSLHQAIARIPVDDRDHLGLACCTQRRTDESRAWFATHHPLSITGVYLNASRSGARRPHHGRDRRHSRRTPRHSRIASSKREPLATDEC
jgi:hypothetical protein